jgi:23S rRNA pseudouridine1911/1915/1917 synthase
MKIKVLYEDSNILAIDKPAGIAVHPDGRTNEKTITDWVLKNYPKMKSVGEPMLIENKGKKIEIKRPGVIHRLDRDTSGVMLLAKNQKAYNFLKEQFKNRAVKKTYHAVVSGWLKEERGVINKPIGRSPSDFRKYSASRGARGEMREATTRYKVLKRLGVKNKFTYLEVFPKTGRTHQIRVHMKAIDHPVGCDPLYNPGKPCPKDFSRMALHAKSIEFTDLKGKIVKVESPLPKEFKKIIL